MAEDYKPRPSGGSKTGWIIFLVAALVLLPLVCCGLGGVGLFYSRTSVQPMQPPVVVEETSSEPLEFPEPPGIVLPSDTPEPSPD